MTQLWGVLMAGGSGTRFWPESRGARPKQLLPLGGATPLLARTSERLGELIPPEQQMVITSARTVDAVRDLLPEIPAEQVIGEPEGRDTAPCLGLAGALLSKLAPDATAVAMPSDHLIEPEPLFREHLDAARVVLKERPEAVLVFGIEPDHAATGYGWLRCGARVDSKSPKPVHALDAFLEKPERAAAEQLLAAGGHLWNAGLFAFRPDGLRAAFDVHLPEMGAALDRIAASYGSKQFTSTLRADFPTLTKISIDFGVMEKLAGALVMPLPVQWDDVGAWGALARLTAPDAEGNSVSGEAVLQDAKRCLVSSRGGVVAVRGVDDLIVVHTPDASLVCRRNDEQGVKQIVDELRARGLEQYL
ncbi:MAG: mannose-1-phosphate guanylyltransferase [Planctomycetota bacterium]|nr:MAG: mannose-1-phosphate guanylyltransferase [Planctomycetota bacterium]